MLYEVITEKCEAAVRQSQAIHGGIGFMMEFDLQLWFRRVSAWTMRMGTTYEHRARIARALIDVLTQLVSLHGAPHYLRSDNAPEFVARAVLHWLMEAAIETALIDPGKPWQNATDESFNGKFRDEYLSLNCVITSYSIHYTKLYEPRLGRRRRSSAKRCGSTASR